MGVLFTDRGNVLFLTIGGRNFGLFFLFIYLVFFHFITASFYSAVSHWSNAVSHWSAPFIARVLFKYNTPSFGTIAHVRAGVRHDLLGTLPTSFYTGFEIFSLLLKVALHCLTTLALMM